MKFRYDKTRKLFLDGDIDLLAANVKWLLVSSAYVPSQANDDFIADCAAAVIVRSPNLAGKTTDNGIFNATNPVVTGVPASQTVAGLVLVVDTGNDATSPLILFQDDATNLPLPTTGGDITLNHSTATEKIFRI